MSLEFFLRVSSYETPHSRSLVFSLFNLTKHIIGAHCKAGVMLHFRDAQENQMAVPVSKRLRVRREMQKDKCKAVCKNSIKERHLRAGHLHLGAGGGRVASWRKWCLSKSFTLFSFIPFIHPPHSIPVSSPTGSLWQYIQMSFFACIVLMQNTCCHFMSTDLVFILM